MANLWGCRPPCPQRCRQERDDGRAALDAAADAHAAQLSQLERLRAAEVGAAERAAAARVARLEEGHRAELAAAGREQGGR